MKSDLLKNASSALREEKERLIPILAEVKGEHKKKERVAQGATTLSLNLYYRMKELEDSIATIDEALTVLERRIDHG